ncbi:DUF1330 domain-containing protein [Streptomyces sp. CBMA152]|uniref:DUF1330 domain-containing protein n=1 Tax=Streptomyces sp. CBMA152 TaxID=1896312 RepID=UPI0016610226|nr:DUF1330 domain-containing protein [Streptomyces sp. CBMA152]MBD0745382.1 hypothetical protein [Streptomyces sp. CBMA152]
MTAYAIANLRRTATMPEDVFVYMETIQSTLAPFDGHFLVHGATLEVREGTWPNALVVIAFPDIAAARAWYDSPEYQALLPLRTNHIEGDAVLVEGVGEGYQAATTAARLRAAQSA